jgi:hypothetical protein
MTKIEREKIVDFIDALMESDYSRANKDLGIVVKEKIKAKLNEAKHVKPFGKETECDDECDNDGESNKSKKGSNKKKSQKPKKKSQKPKKGQLPPWLKNKGKK